MVGLQDLEDLFQPKRFCDSMVLSSCRILRSDTGLEPAGSEHLHRGLSGEGVDLRDLNSQQLREALALDDVLLRSFHLQIAWCTRAGARDHQSPQELLERLSENWLCYVIKKIIYHLAAQKIKAGFLDVAKLLLHYVIHCRVVHFHTKPDFPVR